MVSGGAAAAAATAGAAAATTTTAAAALLLSSCPCLRSCGGSCSQLPTQLTSSCHSTAVHLSGCMCGTFDVQLNASLCGAHMCCRYDRGDHVKHSFSIGEAAMFLAWGALDFQAGHGQGVHVCLHAGGVVVCYGLCC